MADPLTAKLERRGKDDSFKRDTVVPPPSVVDFS